MRIPPSAIVMTLVIAVPFGLAARDTLRGNDRESKEAAERKELADAERRASEARLTEQQADYELAKVHKAQRTRLIASLIGPTPASIGAAFAGVELGKVAPDDLDAKLTAPPVWASTRTQGDGRLVELTVSLRADPADAGDPEPIGDNHTHCELRSALEAAWGPTTEVDQWTDAAHHQRAVLDPGCMLTFVQVVDEAAWATAALPKLIGKTPEQAAKLLGAPTDKDDAPTWYLPGPPHGLRATTLTALVDDGKVIGTMTEAGELGDDEQAALITALTKRLGHATSDADTGELTWGKHVSLSVRGAGAFTVSQQ